MYFEVRHHFPVPAERAWNVFFSAVYEAALAAHTGMPRKLLDEYDQDGLCVRHQRVTADKELPTLMAGALGQRHLTYEVIERYHSDRLLMDWEVIPSRLPDKIKARGIYEAFDSPGGCERWVKGDIDVAIPLVGGKIEKAVSDELKASYERNYQFAVRWLTEHA